MGMINSMRRLQARDASMTFRVHMHPSCGSLQELMPPTLPVGFYYCNIDDHWRFPVLHRSSTLISHPGTDLVVMLDGHDDPGAQLLAIENLNRAMEQGQKAAAFTFWPTDGVQPAEERPSQGVTELEYQVVASTSPNRMWWIDCGLAITTPAFRHALGMNYDAFLREQLQTFGNVWTDFEALSDEALLDMALFKNPRSAALVKQASVIQPHWLQAAAPFDLSGVPDMPVPDYPPECVVDELAGRMREMVIPAQDRSLDQERIRQAFLQWRQPAMLLATRKRPISQVGKKIA